MLAQCLTVKTTVVNVGLCFVVARNKAKNDGVCTGHNEQGSRVHDTRKRKFSPSRLLKDVVCMKDVV